MDAWIEGGTWNGRGIDFYFRRCSMDHAFAGVKTTLTRDVGYHTSGWKSYSDVREAIEKTGLDQEK